MPSSGQLQVTNFFDNIGGLNLADSVFKIAENQAADGVNFDYDLTGGIRKRLGPSKINTVADAQLKTLGFGLYNTASGTKSVIRAAGTKLQLLDTSTPLFTSLSEDTLAASTEFLTSGSTQTVVSSQFNNGSSSVLWMVGGGMDLPRGVYSTTKVTKNGSATPTGTISTSVTTPGSGTFTATGTYFYAVALRKAGTQAVSNVDLDVSATIAATTDNVVVSLASLAAVDTTKYDAILLYRSAVAGVTDFTTGSLAKTTSIVAGVPASITDTGSSEATSQNVPRAGSTILDNSELPAGTYNSMVVFKRRLVVAQNSTLQFSDLNKSESWPTVNQIVVPSGGKITGLAVISYTSPQANTLDELLVIFKDREVWVITGDSYLDWVLKFIDQVGCSAQSLVVTANGFLAWLDFGGVFLWDGTSKPTYSSKPISPLFARDGDLNKAVLTYGTGVYIRKDSQIVWYLSSRVYGEQVFAIKMDTRLTMPKVEQQLTGRNLDAVYTQDLYDMPIYAAMSFIPQGGSDEMQIIGDNAGFCYFAGNSFADGGEGYSFKYKTKPLDFGEPYTNKIFHRVIVWVQELGAWDLALDYWSNFLTSDTYKSTVTAPISDTVQNGTALWDVAFWDVAEWDGYTGNIKPLVYHLRPGVANSHQGTALQIQFRNETADQPIVIQGFSVVWSAQGEAVA
jgi:hypothetical protein